MIPSTGVFLAARAHNYGACSSHKEPKALFKVGTSCKLAPAKCKLSHYQIVSLSNCLIVKSSHCLIV